MSRNDPASAGPLGVEVVNFGCRVNRAESESIVRLALAGGHTDLVVVNTCAVTAEAVRQARQAIRRRRRDRPNSSILVTGCAVEVERATFAAMSEVTDLVGNSDKTQPATWRLREFVPERSIGIQQFSDPCPAVPKRHTRAFVPVQNGCDHRCTFCVIPVGRGRSRSVEPASVIDQVRQRVADGYLEIVLTGIDITSYGSDLSGSPSLGRLVGDVLAAVPELRRMRLSSVDALEVDETLVRAFASESRLMPHLHLSLQAGSDIILKRMKRRHRRADAIRFCSNLRRIRPEIVFGADMIVGFPTESEGDFVQSLAMIEDCGLSYCHVFPFSARPTTPAARMPRIDPLIVKERAQRLRSSAEAALGRHLARGVGRRLSVLTEGGGIARSEDFTKVRYAGQVAGIIYDVTITGANGKELLTDAAFAPPGRSAIETGR